MALSFNGTSDELKKGSGLSPSTMPLTFACWFNPGSLHNGAMISLYNSPTEYFMLHCASGGKIRAAIRNGSLGSPSSTTDYVTDTWQHGVAVFESSTSRSVWLNGGSKETDTNSVTNPTITDFFIGGQSEVTLKFGGSIAECAVWRAALVDDEVTALAKGMSPTFIRRSSLLYYADLIRSANRPVWNGISMTVDGTTVVTHPRMMYPARMPGPYIPQAVGGDGIVARSLVLSQAVNQSFTY